MSIDELQKAWRKFHRGVESRAAKELIENPSQHQWPVFPFLCLVHRRDIDPNTGTRVTALLWEQHPNCVFPGNLYEIPMFNSGDYPLVTEAEFMARKIEYESTEAILKDWDID